MIEINNENKQRFFSQYMNNGNLFSLIRDTYYDDSLPSESMGHAVKEKNFEFIFHWFKTQNAFRYGGRFPYHFIQYSCVVLKPLSSIRDEDVIEIAKLNGWSEDLGERYTERLLQFKIDIPCISRSGYKHRHLPEIFDYLRSKGYAISWMGLSVDDMVEAGWIKLRED